MRSKEALSRLHGIEAEIKLSSSFEQSSLENRPHASFAALKRIKKPHRKIKQSY